MFWLWVRILLICGAKKRSRSHLKLFKARCTVFLLKLLWVFYTLSWTHSHWLSRICITEWIKVILKVHFLALGLVRSRTIRVYFRLVQMFSGQLMILMVLLQVITHTFKISCQILTIQTQIFCSVSLKRNRLRLIMDLGLYPLDTLKFFFW